MRGYWTCQRVLRGVKCGELNSNRRQVCHGCGKRRPPRRRPAHLSALDMPRSEWEARYGTTCNICGAEPGTRALHRDHDHRTGEPRGILCFRCNTALKSWVTPGWLRAAADYLERR